MIAAEVRFRHDSSSILDVVGGADWAERAENRRESIAARM